MPWTRMYHEFFRHRCIFCQELTQMPLDLCQICVELLPAYGEACARCAIPLAPQGQFGANCGACLRQPPPVRYSLARCAYVFPADFLIQQLKFVRQLNYARVMGGLLAQQIRTLTDSPLEGCADRLSRRPVTDKQYSAVDLVLPVPLSPKRYRHRGFNQAAELARFTAAGLALPVSYNTLLRPQDQPPQASLGRAGRQRNILGAFSCSKPLTGKKVALVDDVMTTGATVFEAARTLRQAGAEAVDVWVFARTG